MFFSDGSNSNLFQFQIVAVLQNKQTRVRANKTSIPCDLLYVLIIIFIHITHVESVNYVDELLIGVFFRLSRIKYKEEARKLLFKYAEAAKKMIDSR